MWPMLVLILIYCFCGLYWCWYWFIVSVAYTGADIDLLFLWPMLVLILIYCFCGLYWCWYWFIVSVACTGADIDLLFMWPILVLILIKYLFWFILSSGCFNAVTVTYYANIKVANSCSTGNLFDASRRPIWITRHCLDDYVWTTMSVDDLTAIINHNYN